MTFQQKPIKYGDRIFARLMMQRRTVVEIMITNVENMSQLLGEIQRAARHTRGLCQLYLRNISEGWSQQRPLMLYAETYRDRRAGRHTPSEFAKAIAQSDANAFPAQPRMAFPWETH